MKIQGSAQYRAMTFRIGHLPHSAPSKSDRRSRIGGRDSRNSPLNEWRPAHGVLLLPCELIALCGSRPFDLTRFRVGVIVFHITNQHFFVRLVAPTHGLGRFRVTRVSR